MLEYYCRNTVFEIKINKLLVYKIFQNWANPTRFNPPDSPHVNTIQTDSPYDVINSVFTKKEGYIRCLPVGLNKVGGPYNVVKTKV